MARCSLYALMAWWGLVLCGCGGKATYPVEGKVVWSDGTAATELAGYTVTFEQDEAKVSATGDVQADGTFRVGTHKPNDGAVLGRHRVALSPPEPYDIDRPRPKAKLPPRYGALSTSGLEATIERKTNAVVLKVERNVPQSGGSSSPP